MRLSELFQRAGPNPAEEWVGDAELTGIQMDSRSVLPGHLFVCQAGTKADTHAYLPDARQRGAVAAVVHSVAGMEAATQLGMAAVRLPADKLAFNRSLWPALHHFFAHPTRGMRVYGVTGTNGKTTVAWLIRDLEAALGEDAAYLGTLGLQVGDTDRQLANTTPFATELVNLLAEVRAKGANVLAMEVSSHALAECRADGVEFDVGVYTNLSQDHLDFHGTMEAYASAKARLFLDLPQQTEKAFGAVMNLDDPEVASLASRLSLPVLGFSLLDRPEAGLQGRAVSVGLDRLQLDLRDRGRTERASVPLGGAYNLENSLAAAGALLASGRELGEVAEALGKVRPVPGRFEPVRNELGIGVIVDYAHTPDALIKLLDAVHPLVSGRVITVFGCGGDRDRDKRPKMARAASQRSDVAVLTSDNPRTEDPMAILADVRAGLVQGRQSVEIADRREAIAWAIQKAEPGDAVVIAGKGHENYQIIGETKYPMDDREIAREALAHRMEN